MEQKEIDVKKLLVDDATNGKAEAYKEKFSGFDEPIYDILEMVHQNETGFNEDMIKEMGKRLAEIMQRQKDEFEKRQKGEHDNNSFEIELENFIYN